jgi:hypothetical protein
MEQRTCSIEGCERTHQARGLCATHYNQTRPNRHKKVLIPCTTCGTITEKAHSRTLTARFCSWDCRNEWAKSRQLGQYNPDRKLTTKQRRMALRVAIQTRDYATVLTHVEALTSQADGCWAWPSTDRDGYPSTVGGVPIHRAVAEAKHGAPLGSQPVHHVCANRACVNPDHLQPVTHYDNTAEMLARTYYLRRIAELEQALHSVSPDHPLLLEVGVLGPA